MRGIEGGREEEADMEEVRRTAARPRRAAWEDLRARRNCGSCGGSRGIGGGRPTRCRRRATPWEEVRDGLPPMSPPTAPQPIVELDTATTTGRRRQPTASVHQILVAAIGAAKSWAPAMFVRTLPSTVALLGGWSSTRTTLTLQYGGAFVRESVVLTKLVARRCGWTFCHAVQPAKVFRQCFQL